MTTFAYLELAIIQWAEARKIIPNSKSYTQLLKCVEELGELASAEIKNEGDKIIDGVGDVIVTLIIYCALRDISIINCIDSAYQEIKNRKGILLENGTFVKE